MKTHFNPGAIWGVYGILMPAFAAFHGKFLLSSADPLSLQRLRVTMHIPNCLSLCRDCHRHTVDARLRAAGDGPFLIFRRRMYGAPDNRATQMSLTLTLSRQRERELEGRGN